MKSLSPSGRIVACPHCDSPIRGLHEHALQVVACPQCNQPFRVPELIPVGRLRARGSLTHAMVSAMAPGAGQLLAGKIGPGLAFLLLNVTTGAAAVATIGLLAPVWLAAYAWTVFDAYWSD